MTKTAMMQFMKAFASFLNNEICENDFDKEIENIFDKYGFYSYKQMLFCMDKVIK